MSAFYQLELLEKAAYSDVSRGGGAQLPQYGQTLAPSYTAASPPTAEIPNQPTWFQKNVVDNPWLEGAAGLASFVPLVGGAINGGWQGMRGAYHLAQGNYGQAAEAAAWGAAGFIPGGAVGRLGRLGMQGAKSLRAGNGLAHGIAAGRAAEGAYAASKALAPGAGLLRTAAHAAPGVAADMGGQLALGSGISAVGARLPNAIGSSTAPLARQMAQPSSGSIMDHLVQAGRTAGG